MRCVVALTALLNILGVHSYYFDSNTSAYQRLDLHEKHSSFGSVVCLQDDIALVSAPHFSFNQYQDADGIVYVYLQDFGHWTLIRSITDIDYADQFGLAMAVHTDYFTVIGSPNANKYGDKSGTVYYLYVESNPYKTQMQAKQVVQSERHEGAGFGSSVAVGLVNNEVTVAVGAPRHRGRGAVFTYTRQEDGSLSNEEILYPSDEEFGPKSFGTGVQVGYDMVVGGAPGGKRGFAYVFQRGTGQTSFSEAAVLEGINGYTDDNDDYSYQEFEKNLKQTEEFGAAISIGDGYLFVGAPYAYSQSDSGGNYGSVSIFTYSSGTDGPNSDFDLFQTLFPDHLPASGLRSFFGSTMSYSSDETRLAIGSPYGEYPSTSLGYVTLYVLDSTAAVPGFYQEALLGVDGFKPEENSGDLQRYGETERAGFGSSVAVFGGYVLAGAPQGASHYGDAYFFRAHDVG